MYRIVLYLLNLYYTYSAQNWVFEVVKNHTLNADLQSPPPLVTEHPQREREMEKGFLNETLLSINAI